MLAVKKWLPALGFRGADFCTALRAAGKCVLSVYVPQRLKPPILLAPYGAAEAAPLQSKIENRLPALGFRKAGASARD
jgi:hypothetical protein